MLAAQKHAVAVNRVDQAPGLQRRIDDIAQGRYATYTSAQDLASEIKSLGRQQ